ncbi:potassium-transporting ATPase subunit C [Mucilaginibacter sp. PPCGB 2223]|uniref:K(+)-transporting ATPase subunit C n=1 Tax=Mucilaginibacter sp. PPCGB 2223 TaxID=1886027 RepID=UPI0008269FF7|nr:K(+)-transporting ATPase subunit C [Mucilaginibacter sp. PPCGB 2223]OCX52154.1 potassium-transporting ATPase subunit C [Mucilaginibacter sp. PPCGB 2223]
MKTYFLPSIRITIVLIVLCAGLYPLLVAAVGKLTPGGGDGVAVTVNGKVVGYANVGQKFTKDKYFNSRPSAADYKADASAGSNKGPTNPDYLKDVEKRIDTFLVHNPGVKRADIPAELVTASGSGLDPDLSPAGAKIQAARIARVRGLAVDKVLALVDAHTQKPLWGLFGPEKVNVLQLNVALDEVKP